VNEGDWLAARFEGNRTRLRAVAYRMLGSLSEADDAVQDAWLRLSRADSSRLDNLDGWLTTVVSRVCLDRLRARTSRREEPMGLGVHLPEPIISPQDQIDPEQQVLLAEGVGLALMVVLGTLTPAERLAFVLHDTFALPFDQIASIVECSPTAARQLASRARRRVKGAVTVPDADLSRQQAAVSAFLAAARDGDLDALVAVLDPDVVLRADRGAQPLGASRMVRGARAVAEGALTFARLGRYARLALVNGAAGVVARTPDGRLLAVMGFTVSRGKIVEIDILADPERLRRLD
jgi:RNA polymerase sigma-70 factor (ECF subfamily)